METAYNNWLQGTSLRGARLWLDATSLAPLRYAPEPERCVFKKMTKLERISHIIVIVYSVILCLLGLSLIIIGYYHLNTILRFIFAEVVDVNLWRINWFIFGYLYLSAGLVGTIIGGLLWKGFVGIERLWLLLISSQFALAFIQIGPYSLGSPDALEIIIIGFVCIWSWLIYFRKVNFANLFKDNRIIELILIITLFSQTLSITYVSSKSDPTSLGLSEKEIERKLTQGMDNAFKNKLQFDMYGEQHKKYMELYDFYEQKNYKKVKEIGNFLIENGYQDDRFVLSVLASEAYYRGNFSETVDLLESALNGDYLSELAKPSENSIFFEEAQIHYALYLVHNDLNNTKIAEAEYSKSIKLFEKYFGKNYSEKSLKRAVKMSADALNHFKITN